MLGLVLVIGGGVLIGMSIIGGKDRFGEGYGLVAGAGFALCGAGVPMLGLY